jgi:hypothetical protein
MPKTTAVYRVYLPNDLIPLEERKRELDAQRAARRWARTAPHFGDVEVRRYHAGSEVTVFRARWHPECRRVLGVEVCPRAR